MLIRHAEKPPKGGGEPLGIDETGNPDEHSLTVRGWTRAGALIGYFATAHDGIVPPAEIFAANPGSDDSPHGRRPHQTVRPLAATRKLKINDAFAVGQEADLAAAILQRPGPVLVSWEHHAINKIVRYLGLADFDREWPDRFDLVWILGWNGTSYAFTEVDQNLLAGDTLNP